METGQQSFSAMQRATFRVMKTGAAWGRTVLMLTLLPAAASFAAETQEHHGGAHGAPWLKLLLSAINLLIFVAIVRRYLGPFIVQLFEGQAMPFTEWLRFRRRRIADALAEADRAKREAEALRAEWQRRIEQLGVELEAMLKQARADIAAERDQILAAARRAAEAIRRDAERTAENEIRSAQETLRAEVAAQALAIAERLATQRLTAADQQRFVTEFVRQMERQ